MSKTCCILFISLLFPLLTFGQIKSGVVTYKVKSTMSISERLENSDLKDEWKGIARKAFREILIGLPHLTFQLKFNLNKARFDRQPTMLNDNGIDLNRTSLILGAEGLFYTDIEKGINLQQRSLGEEILLLKNPKLDWQITPDTKYILGYECRKAVAVLHSANHKELHVTAWFAPSLPFQFGPLQFRGLPGLILGLVTINHYYLYATAVKFNKNSITIPAPTKGTIVTKKEYRNKAMALKMKAAGR